MAKAMTSEERDAAANATKARNDAYRARRKLYTQGVAAAEREAANSSQKAAYDKASDLREKLLDERKIAEDKIIAQIQALNEQLEAVRSEYGKKFQDASAIVRKTWDDLADHKKALLAAKTVGLDDVAGCYSAAAWKPYSEFLKS